MKKKTPFLDLYKEWMKREILPKWGLCGSTSAPEYRKAFDLIRPSFQELKALRKNGYDVVYWASGLPSNHEDEAHAFTPLRQTLMLLCAAINGELE